MKRLYISALIGFGLFCFDSRGYSQEYIAEGNHDRVSFNFSAGNPLALPPVGANYLRIISPTILELVRITADTATWDFAQTLPSTRPGVVFTKRRDESDFLP